MSRVLVIDFGSQVTQLIARRVREIGVRCDIVPFAQTVQGLAHSQPKAIILSGAPDSLAGAAQKQARLALAPVLGAQIPILGICYGQQLLCAALGGKVARVRHREFGRARISLVRQSPLFAGLGGKPMDVWMSHADRVELLPKGFTALAKTGHTPFAAMGDSERHYYGVQFHPEVVHTPKGARLLENFVCGIAKCKKTWTMRAFSTQAMAALREQIGDAEVLCALSGGVDSSVVAVLLHKAIGQQLTCIYVDNGLMRAGENAQVVQMFRQHYPMRLIYRKAGPQFLRALRGIKSPERKRKCIGKVFIDVFEAEAAKRPKARFLAQGTLYPDVIESASPTGAASHTIKSHHNVGGLPKHMKLELVEPLRNLFKDEVRALGEELGLPKPFIARHPFPGPGLAVRLPGVITTRKLRLLRAADAIYLDEIRAAGLYDDIWQAFAVLLPVQSVGVMGDARSYDYVCALRAVTSSDGMTADFYPFASQFLGQVATRIINEVKGISRVVYDVSSKPPATIEWE